MGDEVADDEPRRLAPENRTATGFQRWAIPGRSVRKIRCRPTGWGHTTAEPIGLVPVDRFCSCGDQIGEIVHDQVVRGRKPMAPELKVMRGERRDRINERAPIPDDGAPRPPRGMATEQRRAFRNIVAELVRMGVRCGPDVLVIEQLAGMVVWNHRAGAELERAGAWGATARGGTSTTGPWRVYRDSEREIHRLSAELGLSPTARNRVVTGPEPMSELEALLS
jgi:P27 family predicted phage terminase small subunit